MPYSDSPDISTSRFEVFFDGQCPLCRREIELIRKWNLHEQLLFTDIADDEFEAKRETGRNLETLMREIHGRLVTTGESTAISDSKWFTGVDVFREMYSRVGFVRSVWFSRLPGLSHLIAGSYRVFAWLRYRAAIKRMIRNEQCSEACHTSDTVKGVAS